MFDDLETMRRERRGYVRELELVNEQIEDCADDEKRAELEARWEDLKADIALLDRNIAKAERGDGPGKTGPGREEQHGTAAPPATDIGKLRWIDKSTGREVRVFTPGESWRDAIIDEYPEYRDLSLGAYLRAMVDGPQNELERRALAEGTDSAGGYTVPAPLTARMYDALSARLVVRRAGAQFVQMTSQTLDIAGWASLPSGAWRDEAEAISTSSPTVERVQLDAKGYACIVKASRELIADSLNIEDALERAFAQKLALVIDEAALTGSGASDPTGITNFGGTLNTYTHSAHMSDWAPYAEAVALCQIDNAADPSVAVHHPDVWKQHTTKMVDTTGQPLRRPATLEALRLMQTTSCPATKVILGGFEDLLIGMREEIRVEVLRERYMDTGQYGFLCWLRMDVQPVHKESFCVITELST